MKIVADTNTFLAVALNEPEKDSIIELTEGSDLIAPEILPYEIGNALSAMAKRKILETKELIAAWDMVQRVPVELHRIDVRSALEIALKFHIYAYDAYFLECAARSRSPLVTLDRPLQKIASRMGITVLE
jgi:predicted nucleic acid-binding protein